MDRLDSINAFVAVSRAGGFSAAGRELGIPVATLSRRVAELEAALGSRLLRRTTRAVSLTEAGQAYFSTCRRLLDELKEADDAVTGEYREPRGDLVVTAPLGFGRQYLQPVCHDFLVAYPNVVLRLTLADRVLSLGDEHIDVALRIADLPDSRLIARNIGKISIVVCASPDYLARRGIPTQPSELLAHDCIAWSALGIRDAWWMKMGKSEHRYPIHTRVATSVAESAVDAAVTGLGLVQATSYQVAGAVKAGRLIRVLERYELPATPVSLVYAQDRLLPLKVRAFLDFVAPRLTAHLLEVASTFGHDEDPSK